MLSNLSGGLTYKLVVWLQLLLFILPVSNLLSVTLIGLNILKTLPLYTFYKTAFHAFDQNCAKTKQNKRFVAFENNHKTDQEQDRKNSRNKPLTLRKQLLEILNVIHDHFGDLYSIKNKIHQEPVSVV